SVAGRDGAISTLVTVHIERSYKGRLGEAVVLKQPGGQLGDRGFWVAGSPEFSVGQRDLLFLSARQDGSAYVTDVALGQFQLVDSGAVAERTTPEAVIGGPHRRRLSLARLERLIARAVVTGHDEPAAITPEPEELTTPGLERMTVDAFTFMDAPHGRW